MLSQVRCNSFVRMSNIVHSLGLRYTKSEPSPNLHIHIPSRSDHLKGSSSDRRKLKLSVRALSGVIRLGIALGGVPLLKVLEVPLGRPNEPGTGLDRLDDFGVAGALSESESRPR